MKVEWNTSWPKAIPREIAPGLFMNLPGQAVCTDVELDGALYNVEMVLDMTDEGARPTSVQVIAQPGSAPVSGTTLRALRVWDLARMAIRLGVDRGRRTFDAANNSMSVVTLSRVLTDEKLASLRQQGPVDETLEWVAYFYNLAGVLGLPPARQVEVNMGVPRTTASKWVRRARERGLIRGEPQEAV